MAVNEALRTARRQKKKSGEDMAGELGYKSKVSYYNIENEEVEVTLSIAEKISLILEQPMEKLFPKFFNQKVQENRTRQKIRKAVNQ